MGAAWLAVFVEGAFLPRGTPGSFKRSEHALRRCRWAAARCSYVWKANACTHSHSSPWVDFSGRFQFLRPRLQASAINKSPGISACRYILPSAAFGSIELHISVVCLPLPERKDTAPGLRNTIASGPHVYRQFRKSRIESPREGKRLLRLVAADQNIYFMSMTKALSSRDGQSEDHPNGRLTLLVLNMKKLSLP